MGLSVRWSWQSHDHLVAIRRRIRQDKPLAAERVRLRILEMVELLSALPRLGKPGRRRGTREFVIPRLPYIIVYQVMQNELVVLGIFHGARENWEHFFAD
jgi:toxin ParE1/3/4